MFSYKAGPVGQQFLDDRSFIKLIMGPVGSGKSTVALMDVLARVVNQKPYRSNGDQGPAFRRSKCIVLRNTMQQLKSTVKPLIDQWFTQMLPIPLGEWKLTDNTFEMRFRLKDGSVVMADLIMMAADTPDDVRRLLSVEASFAWAEECREIDPEVFDGLQGRVNRYPSRAMGGVTYPGVIGSTNPPPIGGFWHKVITEPPRFWNVFIQPPAFLEDNTVNPDTENLEHLAPDYYEKLISGKSQEWIEVYLKNKFGSGGQGLPVFRSAFKKGFHVATEDLKPLFQTMAPLVIGMDNGLTAAAVMGQLDPRGRVNVLDNAFVPQGVTMGVERFLDTILIPKLRNEWPMFTPQRTMFVLDPACFERSQVNEKTIAMAVNQRGYQCVRAVTNDPERRFAAVEGLLSRVIDGGPGMLISPRAAHFIAAMEWGFRYKPNKDPMAPLVVDKNFYSHIADAGQYLSLHYNVQVDPAIAMGRSKERVVEEHRYVYT
jgi:hypothetical protein